MHCPDGRSPPFTIKSDLGDKKSEATRLWECFTIDPLRATCYRQANSTSDAQEIAGNWC